MESRRENTNSRRRREGEVPDAGTSILVGAIFGLAAYGLYKLIKQETASQPQALPGRTDYELAHRILDLGSES